MRVRELLALILVLLMAGPAMAQDPVLAAANVGGMTVEDLRVTVGKSLVIDYPADISRISTSNPEVVDAVPATSREFLLHGKGHGSATVVVWAKTGLRTMYNVTVEHNLDPIKRLLKETFPTETIGLVAGRDSITLIGTVSSKDVADRAVAIATPLAKTVVSNLSLPVAPIAKQIVLKVRFAELDRTAAQQFGVNLINTGAGNTTGAVTTQQFSGANVDPANNRVTVSDALNIFAIRKDLNLAAFVRALQAQGLLQILAEPNLVTTNGKEASFLVGGEFPVPVLQGGGNAGAVTIQFREFGIRLLFNPLITANNTIKLYVKPEVSTIDLANAVTFSGFTIPALATRRMETNIELGIGQSFVIAGLIDDRVTEQFNKLPGLANIPILGTLFRSRTENRSKSELVIIVTPEIATPISAGDPKPEPAWMRPFMSTKGPGDKVGSDLVPGAGAAEVAPLRPGHYQINRESVGNGAKSHPVTPEPPLMKSGDSKASKETRAAKDSQPAKDTKAATAAKQEQGEGSGKRNPLKLWGRKPAKSDQKAEGFEMRPAPQQRSLSPAPAPEAQPVAEPENAAPAPVATAPVATAPVATAPVATAPVATAPVATAPVVTEPAPTAPVTPAAVPAENTPAPVSAPVSALPEAGVNGPANVPAGPDAKPAEVPAELPKPGDVPAPATVVPATVAPATSAPATPAPASGLPIRAAADEAAPPASPAPPGRRSLSAGITSLPAQVLETPRRSGSTSGQAAAGNSPASGEQH